MSLRVNSQRSIVNWVGNNCSWLKTFLFKGLKFKEFKSQRSMGNEVGNNCS